MKVISKTISYDDLQSKLPGVIPSIVDTWSIPEIYICNSSVGNESFYSYGSAVKRAAEYNINSSELVYSAEFVEFDKDNLLEFTTGNYGLITSDIIIPEDIAEEVTDYTDLYVNIPVKQEDRDACITKYGKDLYDEYYNLSWPLDRNYFQPTSEYYNKKDIKDPHYEYSNGRYRLFYSVWENEQDCSCGAFEWSEEEAQDVTRSKVFVKKELKILTQYTLNKWYVFFKNYFNLIESPDYDRTYESALDYFEKEIKDKNYDLERKYAELDEIFNSRGGRKMYDWICSNLIIQFNIPEEFVNEWKTTKLYYPKAIEWHSWFKDRHEKYLNVEYQEDCAKTDDCCDCAEYLRLGGHEFFRALDKWLKNLHDIDSSYATKSASFTLTINLETSIDDLGQMSILSSEWQEETDYHNTLTEKGYVLNGLNGAGGTVVNNPYVLDENGDPVYTQETYMIKQTKYNSGYTYNEYYENIFKPSDWFNYTDYYHTAYKERYASDGIAQNGRFEPISSYTFSPLNGKVIYNPTAITTSLIAKKIENVSIKGDTYEIIDGKYVQLCYRTNSIASVSLKSDIKLPIYKDGDLEYAIYNGKRKYVTLDSEGKERVYFLKDSNCYDEGCPVSEGKYIIYDGSLYLWEGTMFSMDDEDSTKYYEVADAYFDYGGTRFYVKNDKIVLPDYPQISDTNDVYTYLFRNVTKDDLDILGLNNMVSIYDNDEDKYYIVIQHKFDRIDCTKVSGFTNSKLDLLRRKEITVDDLGNELPGHFKSIIDIGRKERNSIYNNPYDQCTLDILYVAGNVSELKRTAIDGVFIGNIIESVKFYYADDFGNVINDIDNVPIEEYAENDDALEAILKCDNRLNELEDNLYVNAGLYCDITYHLGASIVKNNQRYTLSDEYDKGVTYVDTAIVSKEVGSYYLANGDTFTFNYYMLTQDIKSIYLSEFRDKTTSDITYFEFEPFIFHVIDNKLVQNHGDLYTEEKGWERYNGSISAPLFRNEYNLGISSSQNVDANIYIDRGINSAFEKHLKLQEIRTMESLDNFGNGWFKINKF